MRQFKTLLSIVHLSAAAIVMSGCASTPETDMSWNARFDDRLLTMGRNNWVIITESGYSRKSSPGTEIIATRKALPSVLNTVLSSISDSGHANATALVTSELEHIPDRDAPGITKLNRDIRRILNGAKVSTLVLPEQDIIRKIESEAGNYYTLILKTSTPLPYASVYIKLDSRYWDEEREKRLREALRSADKQ